VYLCEWASFVCAFHRFRWISLGRLVSVFGPITLHAALILFGGAAYFLVSRAANRLYFSAQDSFIFFAGEEGALLTRLVPGYNRS